MLLCQLLNAGCCGNETATMYRCRGINGKRALEWQQNGRSSGIVHLLFLYKLLGNSYLFLLFLVEITPSVNKKPINKMNKMILEISYRDC